jgi:hypothetical protein
MITRFEIVTRPARGGVTTAQVASARPPVVKAQDDPRCRVIVVAAFGALEGALHLPIWHCVPVCAKDAGLKADSGTANA